MPPLTLRDYQRKAVDAIHTELIDNQRTLLVLATGLGKTACASFVIKDRIESTGKRAMFIAHREELIYQAKGAIGHITGQTPDVEMADQWADQAGWQAWQADTIVTSVQTQVSSRDGKGRMERFHPGDFSTLILDEAHRAVAPTWRKVIDHYCQNELLKGVGLTATPNRHDESALGKVFQSCAFNYGIHDGIKDGWLVPIEATMVPIEGLDLSSCQTLAGDFNQADLSRQLEYEKPLLGMVDATYRLCGQRKTLVFCASVAQAERFAEILNRYESGCARFVCGKTPKDERRGMYRDYHNGDFRFLVNVAIAGEGWDEPLVEVVVQAKPTKSTPVYLQAIGRGTRPLPGVVDFANHESDNQHIVGPNGHAMPATLRREAIAASKKDKMEVLDFVGNSGRHKVISAIDVLGGNYDEEVVELAIREASRTGRSCKPDEMLAEAKEKIKTERDRAALMRSKIKGRAIFTTRRVNIFGVTDRTPTRQFGWDKGHPASEKQVAMLKRFKIDTDGMSKSRASALIGTILKRRSEGLCTPKQLDLLGKKGIDATKLRFETASALIDYIAKHGWRAPPEEVTMAIIDTAESKAEAVASA